MGDIRFQPALDWQTFRIEDAGPMVITPAPTCRYNIATVRIAAAEVSSRRMTRGSICLLGTEPHGQACDGASSSSQASNGPSHAQ